MKLLHTADWQLGARFKQFGEKAGELREARFTALRRALEIASDRKVDAFVIAGDLFEDNEVDDAVVKRAVSLFSDFGGFSTFILPGNHDPFIGPGSVWNRHSFQNAPKGVRVFRGAASTLPSLAQSMRCSCSVGHAVSFEVRSSTGWHAARVRVTRGPLPAIATKRTGNLLMGRFTDVRADERKSFLGEIRGPDHMPTGRVIVPKDGSILSEVLTIYFSEVVREAGYRVSMQRAEVVPSEQFDGVVEGEIKEFWLTLLEYAP